MKNKKETDFPMAKNHQIKFIFHEDYYLDLLNSYSRKIYSVHQELDVSSQYISKFAWEERIENYCPAIFVNHKNDPCLLKL